MLSVSFYPSKLATTSTQPAFSKKTAGVRPLRTKTTPDTFTLYFPDSTLNKASVWVAAPYLQKAKLIIEGDLHGNTRKLLELLFISGLVDGLQPQQAEALLHIASSAEKLSFQKPEELAKLHELHTEFKKNLGDLRWADNSRTLKLLGDVLVDRGADDRLTLDVLEHLNQDQAGHIQFLAGNHDLAALSGRNIFNACAKSHLPGVLENKELMMEKFKRHLLNAKYFDVISAPQFIAFCAHAPVTAQQIDTLIAFLNTRKLLPVGIQQQKDIRQENLVAFVDTVNKFYKDTLLTCCGPTEKRDTEAFNLLTILVTEKPTHRNKSDFPFPQVSGLKLIHGHDQGTRFAPYSRDLFTIYPWIAPVADHAIVPLDNTYGKTPCKLGGNRFLYVVPG